MHTRYHQKQFTLKAYLTHRLTHITQKSRESIHTRVWGRQTAHDENISVPSGVQRRGAPAHTEHTLTKSLPVCIISSHSLLSLSFFLLLLRTEFVMSLKIGPILFALTEMSLSGGWRRGSQRHHNIFFHSNRVINIYSPREPVTRLFAVHSRSHASPCPAFTAIQRSDSSVYRVHCYPPSWAVVYYI